VPAERSQGSLPRRGLHLCNDPSPSRQHVQFVHFSTYFGGFGLATHPITSLRGEQRFVNNHPAKEDTMGIFDFLKNIGKDVDSGKEAEQIKQTVSTALSSQVENLNVTYDDGTVTLSGQVASQAAKEKAVLLAGNVKGVEQVNDDHLTVKAAPPAAPEVRFYTIEKGDSLSKIAKQFYGDANKWQALFEANREVIQDPDRIYPGQRIRVPANPNA
jgi:nucleoid-associated protein YgaU